jgi:hypothetical protein
LFTYLSEPEAESEPDLETDLDEAVLFDSLSEPEPEFLSDSDPDSWPDSSPDMTYICETVYASFQNNVPNYNCKQLKGQFHQNATLQTIGTS